MSLEGMARDNAKIIYENGDLHVTHILDGLDSLYGVSMTFQLLNMALCGLQQKPMESACAYYNPHGTDNGHPKRAPWQLLQAGGVGKNVQRLLLCGPLAREPPYGGSLEGPAPHHPFGPIEGALLEQEENDALTCTWYPPSTSARLTHPSKLAERYHRQPPADKRNDGYTVCPAQLDATPAEAVPEIDPPLLGDTVDALETWYNDGFLIGLRQAAEISEHRSGRCFNCQKEGHRWHQCKEILSPELQELSD